MRVWANTEHYWFIASLNWEYSKAGLRARFETPFGKNLLRKQVSSQNFEDVYKGVQKTMIWMEHPPIEMELAEVIHLRLFQILFSHQ